MFYYIGLWIRNMTMTINTLIPFCVFSLISLIVIFRLIHDFHNSKL